MSVFAPLDVKFALSPIAPTGFIEACHSRLDIYSSLLLTNYIPVLISLDRGVLAVPAGLTSNELWSLHCKGAKLVCLCFFCFFWCRVIS